MHPHVLHPNLKGRVAFITGASRGIGKALALRLASEGADVVIAAKSEQSSEKLPGSIHDTAEEVRKLGVRALPVRCDVRSEDAIREAVEKTIAEFGRLDILINNAGALWWQKVTDTPVKRFDLMMQINVRASFITAYYALPHMIRNKWGHVINMCPAISTTPNPGRVAYMATKMGMARLAIGIGAEYAADGIAGNALWPRTIIESQASINWGLADRSQWRTPEILCDATCAILSQEPPSYSSRQVLDEEVLRELAGITNFDHYWCDGKPPASPIYIDGSGEANMKA
ncbi:MAG: SDR family oxidoreductase [Bryobacteraceae bacterium]